MRHLLVTCLLLHSSMVLYAQTGIIQGRVSDNVSNQPIPFATVLIQNAGKGTTSNEEGDYRIEGLSPGQYNLEVSVVGYRKTTEFEIQVTNARPAIVDILLQAQDEQLQTVEVEASGTFLKTDESPLSLRTIGTTEIKRTPGGNRDISKVIRSLPGVSSPPSFRNDIIIRGGAPSENTFYLDGIQIPVINHFQTQGSSGGPVGMINVDLVSEVAFYSGAFPANRGNTLSSVFDLRLKEGRSDKWILNGVLGATDLGLTVEGPVSKKSTLVLSARRSYLKFLFNILNLPFLPVYNDLQFKYNFQLNEKSRITLIGIGAIDDFTLNLDAAEKAETPEEREEAEYTLRIIPVSTQWNYTTGVKYQNFRANGSTSVVVSTNTLNNGAKKYRENIETPANRLLDYNSKEREYRLRIENFSSGNLQLNYGVLAERASFRTAEYSQSVTQQGVFVKDYDSRLDFYRWGAFGQASQKILADKLSLSAGLRMDANNYSPKMQNLLEQFSPRVSASYVISERVNLNFNTGRYFQLPAYTILGYREAGRLVNRDRVTFIRSDQIVTGLEVNLKRNSRLTAEGFLKRYSKYPFQLDDGISLANLGADFGTIGNAPVSSTSEGRSYGTELLFQQKLFEGWYGLVSYTWVRSEFENGNGDLVPSAWDNRHLVSMTGGKRFLKNWEAGFRFLFTGGAPYTPYNIPESVRKENWDVRYFGVLDYTKLNSQRLKPFHQLDLRIDKKYFFQRWSVDVYLDVQNVYGYVTRFQPNIDILRDSQAQPVTDPADENFYVPKFINSTYGTVLPTVGLIIEL